MPYEGLPEVPPAGDIWQRLACERRPLIVYGMGNGADKLVANLERRGLTVSDFMASDGFVRGQTFHGKTVLSFASIREKYPEFVLLLAFATSRPEVLEMLWRMAEEYPLYMPDLPVAGEQIFDAAFYGAHLSEFREVYDLLADDLSRRLYSSVLRYKLTGDIRILKEACTPPAETWALLQPGDVTQYVDCGAYTGDTLRELRAAGAPLKSAICLEPDARNFKKLTAYATTLADCTVHAVRAAAWRECSVGHLAGSGNRNSSLVGASHEHRDEEIPLVTVDSLCRELGVSPDYIKYDVEGAEEAALCGSASTIASARPRLLISLYHRTEDLFALPLLARRLCPDSRFYLRRPACVPAWELNLICVPRIR